MMIHQEMRSVVVKTMLWKQTVKGKVRKNDTVK